jgi:hypothetical protein
MPTSPEGDARPSPEGECRGERSTVHQHGTERGHGTAGGEEQSDEATGVLLHQEKIQREVRGVPRAGRGSTAGRVDAQLAKHLVKY